MPVNRTPSRRLAFINVALYLLCLIGGAALSVAASRAAIIAVREPVTYQPELRIVILPLFAMVVLLLLATGAIGRALAGEPPSPWLSGGTYLATALVVVLRLLRPDIGYDSPLPAYAAAGEQLEVLDRSLARAFRDHGEYPADPAAVLPEAAEKPSPWLSHGRSLPFRVLAENGIGGRLVGREGDLAGTIYYVVSPNRARFWMTTVVLVGAPTGHLDFLRDSQGRPLVVSSQMKKTR